MTPEQAKIHADEVRATSSTILRGLFPVEKIDAWNEAFQPLLLRSIAEEADNPNRGANRYYVTLPFNGLWA
ncbi:MAG: phytanoyl-CoA dioxygenase, partial [Pseudomonadota bacterium]|nr:phytanoyl-CoA dioxygenase [Pseudomonadota bacterium]